MHRHSSGGEWSGTRSRITPVDALDVITCADVANGQGSFALGAVYLDLDVVQHTLAEHIEVLTARASRCFDDELAGWAGLFATLTAKSQFIGAGCAEIGRQ